VNVLSDTLTVSTVSLNPPLEKTNTCSLSSLASSPSNLTSQGVEEHNIFPSLVMTAAPDGLESSFRAATLTAAGAFAVVDATTGCTTTLLALAAS